MPESRRCKLPYNGVGVFQRVYNWTVDAAAGLFIDSNRMDTDTNDIAAGLSNCVTRDGQSPWLQNLPAGGFKLTGLGLGSNTGDSVNYGQVFNSPAFNTPSATSSPAASDNSLKLATTAMVQQVAFSAALPAQAVGILQSDGAVANFTKNLAFGLNFAKAADVASAAAPDIWAGNGNVMHITGNVGIAGFAAAPQAGASRWVVFDGSVLLTNGPNFALPGGANYTTDPGDVAFVFADTTTKFSVLLFPLDGLSVSATPYFYARQDGASGTGAGNAVANDITQTRAITTAVKNTIPGASLASNTITLPAGTYRVVARAPGVAVSQQKIFLYNVTDAAYTLVGASSFAAAATTGTTIDATLRGEFTITAAKNFTIRHWTTTPATNGLGTASNVPGQPEIYTEVEFWKVA